MRFYTALFPGLFDSFYERCAKVLERSLVANMGDDFAFARINLEVDPAMQHLCNVNQRPQTAIASATKAKAWYEAMMQVIDGELAVFMDADMMVLQDLSLIESLMKDHDFGITIGTQGNKYEWNTGFVVARGSMLMRQAFEKWANRSEEFMADRKKHWQYSSKYGGVHQSALASLMLDDPTFMSLRTAKLSTADFNGLNATHPTAMSEDSSCRVVHIIGHLRRKIMGKSRVYDSDPLKPLVDKWREYEGE